MHCGMLPGAKQQDDYPRRGGGNSSEAEGGEVDCCGGLESGHWEGEWPGKGQRDHGGGNDGRLGGSCRILQDTDPLLRRQVWYWDWSTWATVRQGRVVRSRTDYILVSDRWIFKNGVIQDLRHKSDHFMVVGCLREPPLRENFRYLRIRTRLPLRLLVCQTRTRADKPFAELRRAVPKTEKRTACHNSWISAETWRLVNKRVSMRMKPGQDKRRLRRLGWDISELLKEDR